MTHLLKAFNTKVDNGFSRFKNKVLGAFQNTFNAFIKPQNPDLGRVMGYQLAPVRVDTPRTGPNNRNRRQP